MEDLPKVSPLETSVLLEVFYKCHSHNKIEHS